MEATFSSPLKIGKKARTFPSMLGKQFGSVPSVNHCSSDELPSISPSLQEDLWHLPGRLRINPSLWDLEDVSHWLHWAQREYSLRLPENGCFEMNGRALCLLTKEDFRRRCPSSGDVLYEILQCVKQRRRSTACEPQKRSPPPGSSLVNTAGPSRSPLSVSDPQPPTVSKTKALFPFTAGVCAVTETKAACQPEPISPVRDKPSVLHMSAAPPTHSNGSAFVSILSHNQVQSPPTLGNSTVQEPLNLSSRARSRSPLHKANGRIPECKLLWDYVYQLLCDDRYQEYIRWEDRDSFVFRVVDPNGLAHLWGNHKNRDNMTYEKMSRALRHYYKLNIIKKERGQKLLFRFLKIPQDLTKQEIVLTGSPEGTSPQERDTENNSPSRDYSEEHFELSPDPASPQPGAPVEHQTCELNVH
ncbi:transcription factor ETV7 isoform X2 [Thalassophryne amazonica]|uniref:transcription factor ETV7 isoform X2 n=1 Tax=Thalassophryne amazonica TaxID=390379 RepID=UPI00147228A2|nr:transcription factor ETV7 isoform X2 [Thalassophryne amazonica]